MMYHVVRLRSGPEWHRSLPMEEQSGWTEHAAFMDELVDEGFVVLGGPLADHHRVILVVEAGSETEVHERLALDPWTDGHLVTEAVDPWTIRLDGRKK